MKTTIRFRHESATVTLTVWDDKEATVSDLFSGIRRQGHATQLMKNVTAFADKEGLTLFLQAKQFGHPIGPDNRTLAEFYQRFGFELERVDRDWYLTRVPSQELHGL